jgi:hypothetical protein
MRSKLLLLPHCLGDLVVLQHAAGGLIVQTRRTDTDPLPRR